MDKSGKHGNRFYRLILSCDSFTAAYSVVLFMFLLPFAAERGQYAAVIAAPALALLPVVIMPVVYSAVHKFNPLIFGRYHLIMPLSAFFAATAHAFLWSADGGRYGTLAITLGAAFVIVSSVIYRYSSFSMRVRLLGDSVSSPSLMSRAFALLGTMSAIAATYAFYVYDSTTALLNSAYVVAGLGIILMIAQYLASYNSIPRLGVKRVQRVKNVFGIMYRGLDKRVFISSLLFLAAEAAVATLTIWQCVTQPVERFLPLVTASAAVAGYIVINPVATKAIKRRTVKASVLGAVMLLLAAASAAVPVAVKMPEQAQTACLICAGALSGGGGAVSMRQMRMRFITVKPHITSGVVYLLIEITVYIAAAIGLAVTIATGYAYYRTAEPLCFVYGAGFAAALGLIAAMLSRRPRKKTAIEPACEPAAETADSSETSENTDAKAPDNKEKEV